jgi:hypothetical protein
MIAVTLVVYLSAAVALLEQHGMDDPRRLTRLGQPHQKSHPLITRVREQHKLVCIKQRHTHKPIMRDMIGIMIYLYSHASSTGDFGWTTSWSAHCNWMILGIFIGEYDKTEN